MPESELDKQVKEAKLRKLNAEADSSELDKIKLTYELSQSKKFWNHKTIWKTVVGLGGLGFLGFFISYTLIPISQHDNIVLGIQLAKKDDSLYKKEKQLETTQIRLDQQRVFVASAKDSILKKEKLLATIQSQYNTLLNNKNRLSKAYQAAERNIKTNIEKLDVSNNPPRYYSVYTTVSFTHNDQNVKDVKGTILDENHNKITFTESDGLFYFWSFKVAPGRYHISLDESNQYKISIFGGMFICILWRC